MIEEKWKKHLDAKAWDEWGVGGFRAWGHGSYIYCVNLVPKEARKVLDIGCADGWMIKLLQNAGKDAWGITYAKGEYEACQAHGLPSVCGDMHDMPFPDNDFDAVIARQTLEHSIAPYLALKEIGRVLKPGGCLIAHVPHIPEGVDDNPCHLCNLMPKQWKELLEKAGYEITREGLEEGQGYWFVGRRK